MPFMVVHFIFSAIHQFFIECKYNKCSSYDQFFICWKVLQLAPYGTTYLKGLPYKLMSGQYYLRIQNVQLQN